MEASELNQDDERGAGIKFALVNDDQRLVVRFQSPVNILPIDREWVTAALVTEGYSSFFLSEDTIDDFIRQYNTGTPNGALLIGERRDAVLTLEISDDKMQALLSLSPAYGGRKATREMVNKLLSTNNVIYGIKPVAIVKLLAQGEGDQVVVAQGKPVIEGEEAAFECLLPETRDRSPVVKEDDRVDYRDLGDIVCVKAGEPLMRRVPAKQGTPGVNIHGQAVSPKPIKDTPFAKGLEGVELAPGDSNVLVSAKLGQPVVTTNGVTVEDVLHRVNVDVSSGNVRFDGSLEVAGDVAKGMRIEVTGDVVIHGVVEACHIEAGGDVLIKGSIIGSGELRDPKNKKLLPDAAIIKSAGTVSFKFAEYAYIEAGDSIYVEELAMHCEMRAINEVVVGKKGARKGQILGGYVRSGIFIKAMQLGNQAAAKTTVEIAYPAYLRTRLKELNDDILKYDDKLFELNRIILSFRRNPNDEARKSVYRAIKARTLLQKKLKEKTDEKARIDKQIERVQDGQIIVDKQTFAGVRMVIGKADKSVKEDTRGVTYRLMHGRITAF